MKGKVNLGNANGMKKPEARAKLSATRKEMFKSKQLREETAARTRKAWRDGKMEGVAVGRCKWFDHTKPDGTEVKLQGTWELAFARWADSTGLDYRAHRGRIGYIGLDGEKHSYYPDFYVPEWKSWVDIKNDYHYSLQFAKFQAIKASNPGLRIRVLCQSELRRLGVAI